PALLQPLGARLFVERRQVGQRQQQRGLIEHAERLAIRPEACAQRFVRADHLLQRLAQPGGIELAVHVQRHRLVVRPRAVLAQVRGQPQFALRLGRRYHPLHRAADERVVGDRDRVVGAHIHPAAHVPTFRYCPGDCGSATYHAGRPSGSRPRRAPGTAGSAGSITVRGVTVRRGSSPASCSSSTESFQAWAIAWKSASVWAVVKKQGKLSRMWMPRLRIIANSSSCCGWSSSKWVRHSEAKLLIRSGAPTSAANASSSAAIAAVRWLSRCCSAAPCCLMCSSEAFAAASVSGWRTKVPAK